MNIHFNLELSSRTGSKSEKSILIRLTQNRQHRRISTGIKTEENHWDSKVQRVKRSHPLAVEYNSILQTKLKEVTHAYSLLLEEDSQVTSEEVIRSLTGIKPTNFFDFAYSTKLAEIKSRNKLGTYRRYEAVLKKLERYAGKGLPLKGITYAFLKEYSIYLKSKLKNTEDTVSANLSVIRSILNEAIKYGLYPGKNPFDQLKLGYTDNTKAKLSLDELRRIFSTPLPQIPSLLLARDFFLACFLAEGTRAGDMMLMQHENLVNDCLVFKQQKTGSQMVIPVAEELKEIFGRYQSSGRYMFPFLNGLDTINELVINSRITQVNHYLKELAKYCGIFKRLSTHVSRHTYTDLALLATDENIYMVQKSLGHSSVKTTEGYAKNRVNYDKNTLITPIMQILAIAKD